MLNISGLNEGIEAISIVDESGNTVLNAEIDVKGVNAVTSLNIASLQAGIYIVKK